MSLSILQLSKSTYQHQVNFWPLDKSPVFTVATCLLISDSFFFFYNLFCFLWSPFVCHFRNALFAALPVINKALFPCRMQRGTLFLGTVLNLNAGGNVKDSSACLSRALPSLPSLSKYAWLVLTVNRNLEPEHKQSKDSKISVQINMQCVTCVLAVCWCSLRAARDWCLWKRIITGQQIVVFLQTALLATSD